jgi:hypothetical protein
MSTTVAKTYRLPAGLHQCLSAESERLNTSEADVVRLAVRSYFSKAQESNELQALELRLTEKLQASHNSLTRQISQILALAQPEGGDHV